MCLWYCDSQRNHLHLRYKKSWVLKAIFCTSTCLFFIIIHRIHKWRRRNYSFVLRLTILTSLTFKQKFFWILFVVTRLVRIISIKTKEWLLSCHLWIRKFGFIKRVDRGEITTVKDLESFHGGNFTFINSFDKTKFLFWSLPPTQHHSFLETRNLFMNTVYWWRLAVLHSSKKYWVYPLYVLKVLSDVYTNEHVRKCVDLTSFAALFDIREL